MPRKPANASAQLTPKQMRILMLIRDYRLKHGYSPTMQELADTLGVSKVTVFEHVAGLQSKGLLTRSPHRARSLELTSRVRFPDSAESPLQLVGHIAAGAPIEAIENPEPIELEDLVKSPGGVYALKVRGDSMIDEHIADGDVVIVERREQARDGETVVALLDDGEATLKKLYRHGRRFRLQPANPAYEPLIVDNVRVQGVVVGLLRTYR